MDEENEAERGEYCAQGYIVTGKKNGKVESKINSLTY